MKVEGEGEGEVEGLCFANGKKWQTYSCAISRREYPKEDYEMEVKSTPC
jgi:hypothetical protein